MEGATSPDVIVVAGGGHGSADQHAAAAAAAPAPPGVDEEAELVLEEEQHLDRDAYTDALLHSFLPHCIHGFRHDVVELVDAFLLPPNDPHDWTREFTPDRADDVARLLFAGLDAAAAAEDGDCGGAAIVVSAAGFVDRAHMRRLAHAFFHPDLVDVEDEGKDTRSDRSFMANFMAATGFVDRLWEVRRMVEVCRDGDLGDGERRAAVAGMLRRFEEDLGERASAVKLGAFKIVS